MRRGSASECEVCVSSPSLCPCECHSRAIGSEAVHGYRQKNAAHHLVHDVATCLRSHWLPKAVYNRCMCCSCELMKERLYCSKAASSWGLGVQDLA
jgi:hypothetical protein